MSWTKSSLLSAVSLVGCLSGDPTSQQSDESVAGAGYTTFDKTYGGCLDSKNGVNCNNYASKEQVYMSGGPTGGGGLFLSAGMRNASYLQSFGLVACVKPLVASPPAAQIARM